MDADGDHSGWRDFLVNVMGARLEPSPDLRRRLLGKFGEEYVKRKLEELARSPQANKITIDNVTFRVEAVNDVSSEGRGYDIELKGSTDDGRKVEYYVEVKTIGEGNKGPTLTDNERASLIDRRDWYLVAIVRGVPGNPKALIVTARTLLEERWEKALTENRDNIKKENYAIVKNVIDLSQEMIDRLEKSGKALAL
ncbi:DUF3883 domain-containing protein [Acidilobus sp.]|uniref:DUF3883 domain-containing protein n=1 Tax=Acidilobus sp. TaxID=1872109 RepID=UPI003CFF888F